MLTRKKFWDSKLNPKMQAFFKETSLRNNDRQFCHLSKNLAPGSKHQRKQTSPEITSRLIGKENY